MTKVFEFILICLATDAIVTAWFYGSIFATWFKYFKDREDTVIGELMTCSLCLPYHVAFLLVILLWLPGALLKEPWSTLSRVPLYSLAATDIVHFLQQIRPFKQQENKNETE